jgi:large subunit ribosomal protein L23
MSLKPIVTEKAVMMIEKDNVLAFETSRDKGKEDIKKEIEEMFSVKVERVRTMIRNGKKYSYVKLKKGFPAIDVATKLGLM